jgi:hypothetical protein
LDTGTTIAAAAVARNSRLRIGMPPAIRLWRAPFYARTAASDLYTQSMSLFRPFAATLSTTALLFIATPALAQRFTFERTVAAGAGAALDISTLRGKIAISAGDADHILIRGTVTVRVGLDVPANAPALARQVADHPSIEQAGSTVRLRPPTDADSLRAVTISYEIRVPAKARVLAVSDSGAITVEGISGTLSAKTSSAAITLTRLGGEVDITTGLARSRCSAPTPPSRSARKAAESSCAICARASRRARRVGASRQRLQAQETSMSKRDRARLR